MYKKSKPTRNKKNTDRNKAEYLLEAHHFIQCNLSEEKTGNLNLEVKKCPILGRQLVLSLVKGEMLWFWQNKKIWKMRSKMMLEMVKSRP